MSTNEFYPKRTGHNQESYYSPIIRHRHFNRGCKARIKPEDITKTSRNGTGIPRRQLMGEERGATGPRTLWRWKETTYEIAKGATDRRSYHSDALFAAPRKHEGRRGFAVFPTAPGKEGKEGKPIILIKPMIAYRADPRSHSQLAGSHAFRILDRHTLGIVT